MSGSTPAPRRALALAASLLLFLGACATSGGLPGMRSPGSSGGARDGFDAWLARGDVAAAERRFADAVEADAEDAWAQAGLALLARRSLDTDAEVARWLAAVRAAPDGAVAIVALERLAELARVGPHVDRQIEAELGALAAAGRLRGAVAYRARVARISAADASGDVEAVARLRAEYGAVTEWTLVGPTSPRGAIDFDAEPAAERGALPATAPVVPGAPPSPARRIPTPDGMLTLGGEAGDEGIHLLASDVQLSRGGRYLLSVWTRGSARVRIDGATVAERRDFARYEPETQLREVELGAGRHRLAVRFAAASERSSIVIGLSRADGEPSDAAWSAPGSGPLPAPREGARLPPSVWTAPLLAEALEPGGGPALSRLLAARAMLRLDREGAKALLAEAVARLPEAAPLRAALADALADDPTLDGKVARSRSESERRRALARDPEEAEVRVALSAMLRQSDRAADAEALLAGLPAAAAERPAALVERAAVAKARGAPERADALAAAAAARGSCEAREQLYESAEGRDAVADVRRLARELATCAGGRDRLIRHLERGGDPGAALALAAPVAKARPASLDAALARAALHAASGDVAGALRELDPLTAWWPGSTRLWKRIAGFRELGGDRAAARAARERALAVDGSDLALRRALALEDGREVLDELREDGPAAIRAYEAAGAERDTSTALVLDAAAQELHPGGAITDRTHQIVHVLDARGVDKYGEVHLPPGAEILTLRTRKRDGRTLEPDGGRAKGSISLAGLEPGDYVEIEYLRSSRGGVDGKAADPFYFQNEGERLVRSVYVATAPAALGMEVDAHGADAPAPERTGDRVTFRMLRTDVPGLVAEPGAPPLREVMPFVQVGYGAGREALHRRVADAIAPRTRQTLEIAELAREVRELAGEGAGPERLARVAWNRVATRVQGTGSLASEASEVLSRGRGSRTLLLKAVLDALGLEARIALARPFGEDPAPFRFPHLGLYDQTLLRIRAPGFELWVDPDEREAPFGSLPAAALGAEALVLPAPGEPLEVARTPERAAVPSVRTARLRIRVEADGGAVVEGADTYGGQAAGFVRGALDRFDAATRRRIFEQSVSSTFRGGALEALELRGEEDRESELTVAYRARVPGFARHDGGALVAETPILPARLAETFVRVATRKLPLLLAPHDPLVQRIEVVPPEGAALRAAPPLELASRWGRYRRTERLEGAVLVREERLELLPARISPTDYPELARFATAVDAAQGAPLRIGVGRDPGGPP